MSGRIVVDLVNGRPRRHLSVEDPELAAERRRRFVDRAASRGRVVVKGKVSLTDAYERQPELEAAPR